MASPDLSSYFGLQFFDTNPQDVYEAGAAHLNRVFPELILREGHIETHLLEAIGEQVAEAVYAINRLPDGIFEVLLKMFGITRDIGTQPLVNLLFDVNRTDGCLIPSGTNLYLLNPSDGASINFITVADLQIEAGESSGIIPAIGTLYTSSFNGIPSNTTVELLDAVTFVDFVSTASSVYGGRDPESEIDYFSRGMRRLSRLSSTLILPSHFVDAALENTSVMRAVALDNYNPAGDADRNGPVGNDPGYITVAVYGHDEPVTTEVKNELKASMAKSAYSNLRINIIDGTVQEFDVSAKIHVNPNTEPTEIISTITAALKVRYSTAATGWNEIVRRNDIITIISQTPGVAFVEELTTPSGNIQPTDVATLMKLQNVNIEVVPS